MAGIPKSKPLSPSGGRAGFALPLVLGIILILVIMSLGLGIFSRMRMQQARDHQEQARAYYLARRGLARVEYHLAELWSRNQARQAQADGRWQVLADLPGQVRYRVQDERGKLNINRITPLVLRRVLARLGLGPRRLEIAADSILDWIDRDHIARTAGAEEKYYLSLPLPYQPRNSHLSSPGELALVRGVGGGLVFGGGEPALWSLVTTYSPGRRVDLNSAPQAVLACLPGIGPDKARRLVERRRRRPYRGVHEVSALLGGDRYKLALPWLTVSPGRIYTIVCQATVPGGRRRHTIMAVVRIPRRGEPSYLFWLDDLSRLWTGGGRPGHARVMTERKEGPPPWAQTTPRP